MGFLLDILNSYRLLDIVSQVECLHPKSHSLLTMSANKESLVLRCGVYCKSSVKTFYWYTNDQILNFAPKTYSRRYHKEFKKFMNNYFSLRI